MLDAALLIGLSLLWGSAFMFNAEVVGEVPPSTVVAGRLAIAVAVLVPVAALRWAGLPSRRAWTAIVFMAVFNTVLPFTLITAAQEHIDSSVAATLVGTMPLFTLVFAVLVRQEDADAVKVGGLVVGFVGAVVLIGTDLRDLTDANTVAQLAVILAGMSYAASTVVARRYAQGDPLALAAWQMVVAGAIAAPVALAADGAHGLDISARAWLSWLALGALSSGLAYILFFVLVQRLAATQVAVVSYLIPIVATLLGWFVLGEDVGVNLFVGLALILVGVTIVNGRGRRVVR